MTTSEEQKAPPRASQKEQASRVLSDSAVFLDEVGVPAATIKYSQVAHGNNATGYTTTEKKSENEEVPASRHHRHQHQEEPALMHRNLLQRPHTVASASGSWIQLADGRKVLDGCAGAAVTVLGHSNAEVAAAIAAQLGTVSFVHTQAYTTAAAEELAEFLLEQGGGVVRGGESDEVGCPKTAKNKFGFSKVVFVGSGSEATDAAMKLVRQYFFERDGGSSSSSSSNATESLRRRARWIVRRQGYHGNTIGAMSVSSNVARRIPYEDALVLPPGDKVRFVSPAFPYRGRREAETEADYADRLVREFEDEIIDAGPETVMAFMGETMVGATTGCVAAPKGYLAGIRRVCDKYGILMVLDEVMCGVGRTGTYFAFEQEGDEVLPDIVTLSKGLGGGFAPIAAVLVHEKIVETLRHGSGLYHHGHTYGAHALSCAAALAVQRVIRRGGLVEACATKGKALESLLREALGDKKYVGDIRGRGLFWGIEFVRCRETKETFDRTARFGLRVQERAFELGAAVYPGQGTVDGFQGDHVLLAPPLTITPDELTILVRLLAEAYSDIEDIVDNEETMPAD